MGTRLKLARLHQQIANVRSDALHKLTAKLATEFDTIAIEDLNVKGMLRNRNLARSIADASFSEFRRMLTYKAAMTGAQIVVVDRFFPSSKTCHSCGTIHPMNGMRAQSSPFTGGSSELKETTCN